jgi:hypothetical protein
MKKLLTSLLIIFSLNCFSQSWNRVFYRPGYQYNGLKADSILIAPSDTVRNKAIGSIAIKNNQCYIKTSDGWRLLIGIDALLPYLQKSDTVSLVATKHDISLKVDKVAGKQLSTEDYSTAEKSKLAGIEAGANNYVHPANHAPSIITQDASNRFVSDAEKAVWNAKQPAGSYEPANSNIQSHIASTSNPHSVTKTQVGLGNVDNTSDANKPISTATQTALNAKLNTSLKGTSNGLAELDGTGKVPANQLPSFVDDVLEYSTFNALPVLGESGKIYVTQDDGQTYRWSGSTYTVISPTIAIGETSTTAYRGDRGKIAYDHSQTAHNYEPAISKSPGFLKWNGSGWVWDSSNYLSSFTETDPTIYAWAKSATKPSYTASEVGADAAGSASSAVGSHESTYNHSHYNDAYTYSQVGHLPLSGGHLTGLLYQDYPESNTISDGGYKLKDGFSSIRAGIDHSFNIDTYNEGNYTNALKIAQNGSLSGTHIQNLGSGDAPSFSGETILGGYINPTNDTSYGNIDIRTPLINFGSSNRGIGSLLTFSPINYQYGGGYNHVAGAIQGYIDTDANTSKEGGLAFYTNNGTSLIKNFTLSSTGAATFNNSVKAATYLIAPSGLNMVYNTVDSDNTYAGCYAFQAGGGSAGFGGGLVLYGHSHASFPGWVKAGISNGSGGKFSVNSYGNGYGVDVFTVDAYGNAIGQGSGTFNSIIKSGGTSSQILLADGSVLTDNHVNWDKYNQWDGGSSGLNASTARTSLGLVIGTDVLAYRTFGTAANSNTGDFIQNQNASAQTANIWISGSIIASGGGFNSNPAIKIDHGIWKGNALDFISKLKIRDFNYNNMPDNNRTIGLFTTEVPKDLEPYLLLGEKKNAINSYSYISLAIKGNQELAAKVEMQNKVIWALAIIVILGMIFTVIFGLIIIKKIKK